MSIGPAGLQCITADHIKSQKLEALVRVADTRTQNLTEDVRLAAATRTGARAPEQFKFDERLRAVVPGNGQLVSDVLDVRRLESHVRVLVSRSGGFPAAEGDLGIALSSSSFAKNRGANAQKRGAFLDSNWKILRHAHRKLRQRHVKFLLERIA